jgi:RNA polymerase sigma-54 factor
MSELVLYVVGNIDEDGYLRRNTHDMCDDLLFQNGEYVQEEDLNEAIAVVQSLDPPGVGARSLQECLLLQLQRKKEETPALQLALNIVKNYFEELTHKNFERIKQSLKVDDALLREAFQEIVRLNPKPGASWSTLMERNAETVIPDFIVENDNGRLIVSLNDRNRHYLRISSDFQTMQKQLNARKDRSRHAKEAMFYVKQQIESAESFIDSLQRRNQTLMATMTAIVEMQEPFFLEGNEALLRPMILKDIAERTGLDVSTISRVVNSKYVQTEFGIYPLKFFFFQLVQTDSGEELSSLAIKMALEKIIETEDKKKPLTDDLIAEKLAQQGFDIARRTVSKYRAQLGIPSAQMRKEL